jgi:hypothetical protein
VELDDKARAHLLSVYTVERQDDQNAQTVAFAITTAGITYMLVAAAYLADHCDQSGCKGTSAWVQLGSPAIAVALVGFLVLNVAATRMRSVHLQRLEKTLAIPVDDEGNKAPQFHTRAGLVFRPDYKTKPDDKGIKRVFTSVTVLSYSIVYIILTGFTAIALSFGPWTWIGIKAITAGVYILVEVIELVGMIWPLYHTEFST